MDRFLEIAAWLFYPSGIILALLSVKDMVKEKRLMGVIVSISGLLLFLAGFLFLLNGEKIQLLGGGAISIIIIAMIIVYPYEIRARREQMEIPDASVDERDTMFARAARTPGTAPYAHYYGSMRPEYKSGDDHLRGLPGLMSPDSTFYEKEIMQEAADFFDEIPNIEVDDRLVHSQAKALQTADSPEKFIKNLCRQMGAVATGIADLEPRFIYSHKGRHDHVYGTPISLNHPFVIVFLVEMDFNAMQKAPYAETVRESARQYYRAAVIAQTVAAILERARFRTTAQYDAHYDVILPPLAALAGLGEVGRNNILVADKFGSRVRIGAVTTDMPLKTDSYKGLGVQAFCEICKKCAQSCPSHALATESKSMINGVEKWGTRVNQCYGYWRRVGTDCGICMANCPFSKPNTLLHNMIRMSVKHSPIARRLALFMDDLIYGRDWKNE